MADLLEVDRLLEQLDNNIHSARLSLDEQQKLLGQVKVYGRDVKSATPIFAKKGITTLSHYGLQSESQAVSREAMRCLANAMLLNEPSRQILIDLGHAPRVAERLKNADLDDEFLVCRILFLLTYNRSLEFDTLVQQNGLADHIIARMANHRSRYAKRGPSDPAASPMEAMAMAETSKLIFNMIYYDPDLMDHLKPTAEHVVSIIANYPILSPPLQSPVTYLLNALLNLISMKDEQDLLFPPGAPTSLIDRLLLLLNKAVREHPEPDLNLTAASLVTILRKLYKFADNDMQLKIRTALLPSDSERDLPLGKAGTLPARLLQLSVSPHLPTLRDNISNFLFELSDNDPNTFVQNIGYGYASGFLMSHGMPVPQSATDVNGGATPQGQSADAEPVNPITGQKLSAEQRGGADDGVEMTEDEKEREAERLFVLFERLRATGVVDVENPVKRARDEGRFEEIE
nr:hypothetical protein B0A51_07088 [Rachicladosporium sp. CCFEE 5018]